MAKAFRAETPTIEGTAGVMERRSRPERHNQRPDTLMQKANRSMRISGENAGGALRKPIMQLAHLTKATHLCDSA
jgi:hypothetical protein